MVMIGSTIFTILFEFWEFGFEILVSETGVLSNVFVERLFWDYGRGVSRFVGCQECVAIYRN